MIAVDGAAILGVGTTTAATAATATTALYTIVVAAIDAGMLRCSGPLGAPKTPQIDHHGARVVERTFSQGGGCQQLRAALFFRTRSEDDNKMKGEAQKGKDAKPNTEEKSREAA